MNLVINVVLCFIVVSSSLPVDESVADVLSLNNAVQADTIREKRQFGGKLSWI